MADDLTDDTLVMIHPRVRADTLRQLDEYCRREDRNQSAAVRRLLDYALTAYEAGDMR